MKKYSLIRRIYKTNTVNKNNFLRYKFIAMENIVIKDFGSMGHSNEKNKGTMTFDSVLDMYKAIVNFKLMSKRR